MAVAYMDNRVSLKKKVYDAICADISGGRYKPNDILTEGSLVEKYAVSKAPVREALIELCKDNFLRSLPRLGYQVVSVTLEEIVDLLDFRVDLELSMLKRAIDRLDEKDIEELRTVDKEASADDSEIMSHWNRNLRFHLSLGRLGGNRYADKVLEETMKQCSRFASQYFINAWSRSSESQSRYHNGVIEALEQRNLPVASEMLRQDILAVKQEIQLLLR